MIVARHYCVARCNNVELLGPGFPQSFVIHRVVKNKEQVVCKYFHFGSPYRRNEFLKYQGVEVEPVL